MAEDKTTVEISESVRDRLREMKDERHQTYDTVLDQMLSSFGYPDNSPIDSEYQFTDPECVFRCETDSDYPLCVNTTPYVNSEAYLYNSQPDTLNDFLNDFDPLMRYFGLYYNKRQYAGSFVIHQDGYNWFGLGFDNFLEACSNQKERYGNIDDLDPHHNEMAVYVYHGDGATLLIYGQPNARFDKDYLKQGGITLLTYGCPTRRDFINLLEQVPLTMSNGLSWDPLILDWWDGRSNHGPWKTPSTLGTLDPESGIPITDDREWITSYVCENPYYKKPEVLLEEFGYKDGEASISDSVDEGDLKKLVEKFAATKKILLRSMPHKPNEDTYYEYERLTIGELPPMAGIGGGITANIKITPQGDYY